jgi:hypothetical protein
VQTTKPRQYKNTTLTVDPVFTEEEFIEIRAVVLGKVEHDDRSTLR